MNSYFARLAEMSGFKVKAHGIDTKSTKVLIDGNDKYVGAQEQKEEDDRLTSLFRMEEGSGFDITSASRSEKEEMPHVWKLVSNKHEA